MLVAIKFESCYANNPHATVEHGMSLVEVNIDWVKAESIPMYEWLTASDTAPGDVDVDADDADSPEMTYMHALALAANDYTNPHVRFVYLARTIKVFGEKAGNVSHEMATTTAAEVY